MGSRAPRHPTKVPSERSAGGVALRRTGVSQPAIAAKVGVDASAVNRWISGAKKPGPVSRTKIAEHFGIASESWDEPASKAKPATKPPAPAPPADLAPSPANGNVWDMARALMRDIQSQLEDLFKDGSNWAKAERAQVSQRLAGSLNMLAKLTGENDLEKKFFDLPSWKMVEQELGAVLEAHPAAAEAVRDRFAALRSQRQ